MANRQLVDMRSLWGGCSFKQVTFFTTFRLITSLTFDLLTSISNQFIVATARNSAQTLCHKLEKLLWESGRVNFTHGHIAAVMYVRRGQMNIIINKVLIKVTLNKLIAGALYIKCVRLSRPLVGFWAHFKSPHFHSFIHSFISFIHSHLRLKRCESTGLTVNSRMTIETKMSLNADGNTAVTACLWQQLTDCSMRVMLLRETNGQTELTDGLTALTAWVTRQNTTCVAN